MKRIIHLLAVPGFAVILLSGCKGGADLNQPPNIRYGEDPCDECHMIISEARYAGAFVTQNGQGRRFDDIGCMLIYQNKRQENVANFWVADYQNQEWINANRAYLVKSDSLTTPMGFGIVAFASKPDAGKIVQEYRGRIEPFAELLKEANLLY